MLPIADGGLDLGAKRDRLQADLASHAGLVVAFSGGVDSTYLLAEAVGILGDGVVAVTAVSPSLAPWELDDAREFAAVLGAQHLEVETDEHHDPAYVANGPDRCFHCKSALFDRLEPLLDRYPAIAIGAITDDLGDHRPGMAAARDRGVRTPLADAGFSKADVRAASRRLGLPSADKPAAPCLASRIAYGQVVTPQRLDRIATAEAWLRARGFEELRVRDHGDLARVEVPLDRLADVTALAVDLDRALRALGWRFVTIDAGGLRSGSLNPP